jgi:hypothetical protein
LLSQTTQGERANFAAFEVDDPITLPAGFPVGVASDAELQDAVFGAAPSGADSNNAGGVIALDDGLSVAPSDADLDYAWRGDDYGLSISGLEIGPQDLYATRPVSERLGVGEPTALAQIGEGAYNKLQAQWDWAGSAAVNAWQRLSTDPLGTLMQGTGAVLSFAGNAVYDTALFTSDQIAVSANLLSGGLIPATDALQRNVDRTESFFGGVYNIEQAIDNKEYGLAGGLAVEGFETALLSLATRGRGQLFDTPYDVAKPGDYDFMGPLPKPDRLDQLSGIATPLDPKAYSVLYETNIGDDILSIPRRDVHFKKANENLLNDVNADPELDAIMETLVPGFRRVEGVKVPAKGISPSTEVTWHHKPGTDKLELVWRYQHEQSKGKPWNALWQELFHPNNRGGFADGKK